MINDCGKKGRCTEPAGARYHSTEHSIGPKMAFLTKLKFSAQMPRKLKTAR